MSKKKTNIKKGVFKVGDCFVGRETIRGISLIRVVVDIEGNKISYQNSNDSGLFCFTKDVFRFILTMDESKYLGNINSN